MCRIVVQCQYTGHYILTGLDTKSPPALAGGRLPCPYCETDHVWTCARPSEPHRPPPRALIRQAG